MENNVLTLRGERKFEEETNRDNYHRVERRWRIHEELQCSNVC